MRTQVTSAIVYDLEQRNLPVLRQPLPPGIPLQAAPDAPKPAGYPVVANHKNLETNRVGHITPLFDADGPVRRLYPLICRARQDPAVNTECHAALALATYAALLDNPRLRLQPGQGLFSSAWELLLLDGDATLATLPLTKDGALPIPYRHSRQDWLSISATDILNHRPDPKLLNGVVVLLGGTALGMTDIISTPQNPVAAGLEPHAEFLSALLDNEFHVPLKWGRLIDIGLLLPFAALLAWALGRYDTASQRAIALPVWLLLTWSCGALASFFLMRSIHLLLPLSPLFLFPPLALLLMFSAELYRAGRESAGIFALLSAYLPRPVARLLAESGNAGAPISTEVDASRREITVLFADINDFTAICENLPPETVASLMQRVFTEMAGAVVAQQGTIDKYIGDAIMAFWNAPENEPEHARRALAAAQDIQQRVASLGSFCQSLGINPLKIGIGIETGYALVGNFGPIHRRTYTALGEPVILASRIEALTASLQQPILIGQSCAEAIGRQNLTLLGLHPIRGRKQALELYTPG